MQGIDDIVEADGGTVPDRPAWLGSGASICGPGRQNCPLLVRRQIAVVDDVQGMIECVGRVQQRSHFKRRPSSVDARQSRGEAVGERLSQKSFHGGLLLAQSALNKRAFKVRQMRYEQPAIAVDILLMRTQQFQVYEHDPPPASGSNGT